MTLSVADSVFRLDFIVMFEKDVCDAGENVFQSLQSLLSYVSFVSEFFDVPCTIALSRRRLSKCTQFSLSKEKLFLTDVKEVGLNNSFVYTTV